MRILAKTRFFDNVCRTRFECPPGAPNGSGRPAGRMARLTVPDGLPNGPDGPPNGPDSPPNGLDGPPNGLDGPPNGPDGLPNGPDGPPNGSGQRSRRPSAPTVQPNQTNNNGTHMLKSLETTSLTERLTAVQLIYCLYIVHKSVSEVLVPSTLQKYSIYGSIYHRYIRPSPIYPSPQLLYCLYIV